MSQDKARVKKELTTCQEMAMKRDKRLRDVKDEHLEQIRIMEAVTCTLREGLVDKERSRVQKLAPRSGEVLARQQPLCILQLYSEFLSMNQRSYRADDSAATQARDAVADDDRNASSLSYE